MCCRVRYWAQGTAGLASAAYQRYGMAAAAPSPAPTTGWCEYAIHTRHIWPTHHENIHFYGTNSVDVAGEFAKLGADGYRPLRTATVSEPE